MNTILQYFNRKKYWLNDFLRGGYMWKNYNDVCSIMNDPYTSYEKRKQYLSKMIYFVCDNIPFYKQCHYKELQEFPIVNKNTYINNYEDFVAPLDKIKRQVGDLHIQKTSGSTGTPFEIPQDTLCRVRRLATIKAMNELVGFHSFAPLMHMRSFAHYYGGGETL